MDDGGRRFTDEEFARILRIAAESGPPSGGARHRDGEGLTLAEMTQIAGEVGIEASLVEQAARRLSEDTTTGTASLLGGPARLIRRDSIPGSVPPDSAGVVVDVIRDAAGQAGEVREELGRLVWSSVGAPSQIRVVLAPGDERTEVTVSAERGGALVLTWAFPVLAGMVGAGIVGAITEPATVTGGVALFAGMTAAGFLTARTLWARGTRAMRRKLDALLTETRRAVASASGAGSGGPPGSDQEIS
jgi:hypothetical protein